jgi:hypothetical protein
MKLKAFSILTILILIGMPSKLLSQKTNYDESLVKEYELPDPLVLLNSKKVKNINTWENIRRPEILELFEQHVYGKFPKNKLEPKFRIVSLDTTSLKGKATKKEISIVLGTKENAPVINVLLYLPNQIKGPVPMFLGLNFYGNHTIIDDKTIQMTNKWMLNNKKFNITENKATEESRGAEGQQWPIENILAQGYGVATVFCGDMEEDFAGGWEKGIRFTLQKELNLEPQEWSAIGAWAWGLSRAMDYLEQDSQVDSKKVMVLGHSRLGKAALWAGANDTRFAMIVSNNSGESGAALARRNFGETIADITQRFPWWFNSIYPNYAKNPNELPLDQHFLLSLAAPRPLYVTSASEDLWADPRGEFLGLKNAEPVYALYKKLGINQTDSPSPENPVGKDIRYHIRKGKHDILWYDWKEFIRFANEQLK